MIELKKKIEVYLQFCEKQKRLDVKTLKAYKIDLSQYEKFSLQFGRQPNVISNYISFMHERYEPKTVKRKIASLKAFSQYLVTYEGESRDLFYKVNTKFREPNKLPKIIEIYHIRALLSHVYAYGKSSKTVLCKNNSLRDIAVTELLLGTGIRVSELCSITISSIDLISGTLKIFGKGAKERILSIENKNTMDALKEYAALFVQNRHDSDYFFINNRGNRLSEQSVRFMLKKYAKLAGISQNITPHMFRHSFATLLLEQDVDIRFIQKMLGHSSISTTEIYTYVSNAKQRDILLHKNPRNLIKLC